MYTTFATIVTESLTHKAETSILLFCKFAAALIGLISFYVFVKRVFTNKSDPGKFWSNYTEDVLNIIETTFEWILYQFKIIILFPILLVTYILVLYAHHQTVHILSMTYADHVSWSMIMFESVELVLTMSFVIMLILGTYSEIISSFDKIKTTANFMKHLDMNALKVKLSVNLIGLSSIHLMSAFTAEETSLIMKSYIHLVLCVSAYVIFKILWGWISHNTSHKHKKDKGDDSEVVTTLIRQLELLQSEVTSLKAAQAA